MLREILYRQTTLGLISNGLDTYATRQRAIASNIANHSTPGYQERVVDFEERLQLAIGKSDQLLAQSHPSHEPVMSDPNLIKPLIVKGYSSNDPSNPIKIENEIVNLATNQIQYRLAVKKAMDLFGKMRSVGKLA
jgi:flagellar basal-body rod protein FlgB